jgi:hypothetical protein
MLMSWRWHPDVISTFKPKSKPKQPQSTPSSVVLHHNRSSTQPGTIVHASAKDVKPTLAQLTKEMNFDVLLLRCSLFIDCLSHTLVSLSPADAHQAFFVGFTALSSLGSGVQPGASSLALCIAQMRAQASGQSQSGDGDGGPGRVFGALASLQAVGQMILGVRIVIRGCVPQ